MYTYHRETSLPSSSPIDLTELKDHLRLFGDDSVTDDYLTALISTAVDVASTFIGESIGDLEIEAFYTDFNDITLPHRHVASVGSVQYYNSSNVLTDVDDSVYFLDNTGGFAAVTKEDNQEWPSDVHSGRKAPVVVTYDNNAIEDVTHPRIEQAILMICSDLYENPASAGTERKSPAMLTAERLLKPFQKRRLGI